MNVTRIKQSQIEERWFLIDASNKRLGVLSTMIAHILQHKNDPFYRRNLIPRHKVIVINTDKLDITPKRALSKYYKSYSGYPGGLRFISLKEQMKKDSTKVVMKAVKGMLPKNKRSREMLANLYIYRTSDHPHKAQDSLTVKIG